MCFKVNREKFVQNYLEKLKSTFNERLLSVFIYGSCSDADCPKSSDINLMVIVKDLCALDLKLAHSFSRDFHKIKSSAPVFMDKDEWFNSCDVYPMEYADIIERHRILFGEDLISSLSVDKNDLRLQCELEIKNLLIRLRQTYLANAKNKIVIKKLLRQSSKTFMVIFRTVLRLSNETVPKAPQDVVKLFCEKVNSAGIDSDCDMFMKIFELKEKANSIKDKDFEAVIQKLIDTTICLLKYVDKIKI